MVLYKHFHRHICRFVFVATFDAILRFKFITTEMFKYAQKVFEKVSALKLSGTPNLFRYTSGMGTTKRKTSGSSFRPTSTGIICTTGDSLRSGSTACSPHSKGISVATGESEATRTSISTSAKVNSFPLQFFTNEIDNENLFLLLNPPLKKNPLYF